VVWCGVVWCGVVWCGVVWCGVVLYNRFVISLRLSSNRFTIAIDFPCHWNFLKLT
jgi:hypothetical protein